MKMNAQQVARLIEEELRQESWRDTPESNPHGLDFDACLVRPPRAVKFKDSFADSALADVWLVLEEAPGETGGYLIIFDEARGSFGLAGRGQGTDEPGVIIGFYGSFLATVEGM